MPQYIIAATKEDYSAAATLFKEYASWLNIDLSFQHFEEELSGIKQMYRLPEGGIILCKEGEEYIACVGIRKHDSETAEMKRMYVKPSHQGKGVASELVRRSLQLAKDCNYTSLVLDTLSTMIPAMNLYKKSGFREIPAYYHNPNKTVIYFKRTL
ncbi:GNAT family N-acetyltransferase [Ferruginibacter sp. HRS2-29]|uniref:GNAT family N-acetyltransferase n=1 Tax=Ferruginibacter sp. HRS2-29 TaxID=2487334 RepID=UPI0020CD7283|nr:GNAT family N-acetyltransferase [Ferruginibacter sp. HRS2-29]MCP9752937.1 GNAT family N-acetyltransferase [Ferruginibacter sp. HRS2-29]